MIHHTTNPESVRARMGLRHITCATITRLAALLGAGKFGFPK